MRKLVTDIDSTGAEALIELVDDLRALEAEVKLARVHRNVYAALERAQLIDHIGSNAFVGVPDEALPPDE